MSQKRAKRARQAQSGTAPPPARRHWWNSVWMWVGVGAAVVAAVVGGTLAARSGGREPALVHQSSSRSIQLSGRSPITGRKVSLAAYRGRPVVLNIWASWCTGCRQEARDLAAFARAHPGAQLIGLDTQDTDGDARAFYREFGWTHPSIRDPSGDIAAQLGLQGLPTTLFLDRQHRVVSRIIGASNEAGFAQGLRAAEQPS